MVTKAELHYTIMRHITDNGYAPDVTELSRLLRCDTCEVEEGLQKLQEYHGVVLHPNSSKVWAIHPFSLTPTNFVVRASGGLYMNFATALL